LTRNKLFVAYGNDRGKMAKDILAAMEVHRFLPSGARIALKPNLVVAKTSASGATTDPELVRGVLGYLHDYGWRDFAIMEGSWLGTDTGEAFTICGYRELAGDFQAELIDLKRDAVEKVKVGELEIDICRSALSADVLINLPVLKAHSQTGLTCALKNLKGCLPDREKRRFHALGLHHPIAALAKALPVALVVVDAVCGDLSFEEGGHPVQMDRVIGGIDPVLVDTYAAALIGYHPREISYIGLAAALGVGNGDLAAAELAELNPAEKGLFVHDPKTAEARGVTASWIEARDACSACYSQLSHALARLREHGRAMPRERICVGQGFKGRQGAGIGVGQCTAGLARSLPGCPPSAQAMLAYLRASIPLG